LEKFLKVPKNLIILLTANKKSLDIADQLQSSGRYIFASSIPFNLLIRSNLAKE
jgi:hypothetical protein